MLPSSVSSYNSTPCVSCIFSSQKPDYIPWVLTKQSILEINSVRNMYVFFMSSMAYLFIFLIVSFDKHKFYNFKEVLFKKLGASLVAQTVKHLPAMWETLV